MRQPAARRRGRTEGELEALAGLDDEGDWGSRLRKAQKGPQNRRIP